MLKQIISRWRSGNKVGNQRNIILTGVPRSGTTLCCFLLSKIDNTIALNEPLRIGNINSRDKAMTKVGRFYRRTRKSLVQSGEAMARATEAGISDNNFSSKEGSSREKIVKKRMVKFDKPFNRDCVIAMKHNALFTILLKDLKDIYPTYAIIRNPVAVLGSWNSVDVPVASGNVRAADVLEPSLNRNLASLQGTTEKQLFILNWYFERYGSLEQSSIIKYEDVIESNGHTLSVIHPLAKQLTENLSSRNKSKLYEYDANAELFDALLNSDNACWNYYDREEARALLK